MGDFDEIHEEQKREYEVADAVMMEFRSADNTWPGMRGMLAEAARRGRESARVLDDDGVEPIETEPVLGSRKRQSVRDLLRACPSGSSRRADDPGGVWLRFSAEDAARIQAEGAFVVHETQPEKGEAAPFRKLYVVFDYPYANDPPRDVDVEYEAKGRPVGAEAGVRWDRRGSSAAPWRLGPFLPVSAAGLIAQNAIGLFREDLERRFGPGWLAAIVPEALMQENVLLAESAAVAEVMQGVEADLS